MSQQTENKGEKGSYYDTTKPTLSVVLRNGREESWGLHLAGRHSFLPKNVTKDVDQHDTIVLRFMDDKITILGFNLRSVISGLNNGQGGVLEETGGRYDALRNKGEAFVSSIELELSDDD